MAMSLGGYVALQALRSRRPEAGLAGAVVAALAPGLVIGEPNVHLALHCGVAFLVAHCLRWQETVLKGVVGLRIGTAVSWMTHAFVWTRVDAGAAVWVVTSAAVLILLIYGLLRLVTGQWGARVVPAGAAISFLAAPANSFLDLMRTSPVGLVAVLGTFALFGNGTFVPLIRHRWRLAPAGAQPRREGAK